MSDQKNIHENFQDFVKKVFGSSHNELDDEKVRDIRFDPLSYSTRQFIELISIAIGKEYPMDIDLLKLMLEHSFALKNWEAMKKNEEILEKNSKNSKHYSEKNLEVFQMLMKATEKQADYIKAQTEIADKQAKTADKFATENKLRNTIMIIATGFIALATIVNVSAFVYFGKIQTNIMKQKTAISISTPEPEHGNVSVSTPETEEAVKVGPEGITSVSTPTQSNQ